MSVILGLDPVSICLTFILFLLFLKVFRKDGRAAIINKIPGPTPLPLLGNMQEALEKREVMMENRLKREQKYGSIFKVWIGPYPQVILSSPEHMEIVLRSSKHSQKGLFYKFLHSWLGTGLLTSEGQKWAIHRKLITPTFHFTVLQSFLEVFYEKAEDLVKKLEVKAKTEEVFNIFPIVTHCALDIICETAMGTKINALNDADNQYVQSVYSLSTLLVHRMARLWYHPDCIYYRTKTGKEYLKHIEIVQGFTNSVIKSRKKALEINGDPRTEERRKLTFLDLLLEASSANGSVQLTDEELREEVDTFMFEGHDTTAAAMNWTLFLLGHHPKIQEDVYHEVIEVLGEQSDTTPTMAVLAELKLLERVVKESLRLYPSVPTIARILEEDTQFGEYLVPKGTTAVLNFFTMHRNASIFPEPEKFDPDRFLPENSFKRHPYAFVPFSAGPRNCIGQKFAMLEEKVVLATLIRHFKFESIDKPEDIIKIPELILRPISGIRMKITRR